LAVVAIAVLRDQAGGSGRGGGDDDLKLCGYLDLEVPKSGHGEGSVGAECGPDTN
jgi:hypothetical protein